MGILKHLAAALAASDAVSVRGDVVGEYYYQPALKSIVRGKSWDDDGIPVTVTLQREPDNPHDTNAVQCLIEGQVVGHIDREAAAHLQAFLRKCERRGQQVVLAGHIVKDDDGTYYVDTD